MCDHAAQLASYLFYFFYRSDFCQDLGSFHAGNLTAGQPFSDPCTSIAKLEVTLRSSGGKSNSTIVRSLKIKYRYGLALLRTFCMTLSMDHMLE